MTASDAQFSGAVPDVYDRLMVPLIFAPYAEDMAARVAALAPRAVLETAAGSGAVTRALAAVLPPATRIVATDLSGAMLAAAKARQGDDARTDWAEADATALPYGDGQFDAVVCQFGAMFFPDRVRGYAEALRVLRPGGTFLFSVWDRLDANAPAAAVTEALTARWAADPPTFMARTPHGHHDGAVIDRELRLAGFGRVQIDAVDKTARAGSARDVAMAYCQGTPVRAEIEAREPGGLAAVTAFVEAALIARFGAGPVEGAIRAYVITARA